LKKDIKKDIKIEDRVIISIDTSLKENVFRLCSLINNKVSTLKLGLEVIYSNGFDIIKSVISFGYKVMLDLKFLDIPNTVSNAIKAVVTPGVSKLTIHTTGGENMLKSALSSVRKKSDELNINPPKIFGVTILTSLDNQDLEKIGYRYTLLEEVLRLSKLALLCNLEGVICSPNEVLALRENFGNSLLIATPGIRLENDMSNDQKRYNTPYNAIKNGADYIIIGRSITGSSNPSQVIDLILEQVSKALI